MGLLLTAVVLFLGWYLAGSIRSFATSGGKVFDGPSGSRVRLFVDKKTGRIGQVRVGVAARTALDFECKPETGTDRFFKESGFTIEHQIGNGVFDDRIYLVSDDPRVSALLRQDAGLTAELARLFNGRALHGFALTTLRCSGGTLSLRFLADGMQTDADPLLATIVPRMQAIAAALPPASGPGPRPAASRAHDLILCVLTALVTNAVVQLIRLRLGNDTFVLDLGGWLLWGSLASAALFAMLLGWTVFLLKGGSRFHLALLQVVLAGGLGSWCTGMVLVRDLNISLPQPQGHVVKFTVQKPVKSRSRGGKAKALVPRCRMRLFDAASGGVYRRVPVRCSLRDGNRVAVVHEGALGIAWVSVEHRAVSR